MSDLRIALEAAIAEDFDDLAAHAAYADLLTDQGDPRGELIQVQLALEDESRPAAERRKLRTREKHLLQKHEREWLGELAPYLLDGEAGELEQSYYAGAQKYEHAWRRGSLDSLRVHFLTCRFAQVLARAPAARLLRRFQLDDDAGFWEAEAEPDPPPPLHRPPRGAPPDQRLALYDLPGAPCLRSLRVFQVGNEECGDGWTDGHCYTPALEAVVARMPRVEELRLLSKDYDTKKLFGLKNLTQLRVLQVEHQSDYPTEVLARNPALANLTHLAFHPHYYHDYDPHRPETHVGYLPLPRLRALVRSPHLKKLTHLRFRLSSDGDDGIRVLTASGFLDQLRLLDLSHGCVTDVGARMLADHPSTRKLEVLDLSRNQLTAEGVARLRGLGVAVRCDDQQTVGSTEYLTEGDFE